MDKNCKDCIESKVPKNLQEILKDKKKREKLIIFINPPYAEAGNAKQTAGTGANKPNVALDNATYEKYKEILGKASNELFAQFFIRIYCEIPHCTLAAFLKLKYINSSNFVKFRETFQAKFLRGFAVPAFTFDNVKGQFHIGFLVWDLSQKVKFRKIKSDSICHSEALAEESQNAKSPRDISASPRALREQLTRTCTYDKKPKQRGFEQKDFYVEQTSFIPTQPLSFSNEAQAFCSRIRALEILPFTRF